MLVGIIHKGSGIGDSLFSYIITRVKAADLGVPFGFIGKEFFKGASFMNLDWGEKVDLAYVIEEPAGKLVVLNEQGRDGKQLEYKKFVFDKPYYDPEVNFIEDGTIIDGYGAQDPRYFKHHHYQIQEWLKTEKLWVSQDTCVINFRGGEFYAIPELGLPQEYWDKAITMMKEKYPKIKFEVHTDDPDLAKKFFPGFNIIKDISKNWRSIRYAKHLIISNSAFAIIPALLNSQVKEVIAPRYWARRNIRQWSMPSNYYKKFTYI